MNGAYGLLRADIRGYLHLRLYLGKPRYLAHGPAWLGSPPVPYGSMLRELRRGYGVNDPAGLETPQHTCIYVLVCTVAS